MWDPVPSWHINVCAGVEENAWTWTQQLCLPVVNSRLTELGRAGGESECLILTLSGSSIASSVPIIFTCTHHTQPSTRSSMMQLSLSKVSPWPSLLKTPGFPFTFHNPSRTKQLHSQEFIQLLAERKLEQPLLQWSRAYALESEGQVCNDLLMTLGNTRSALTHWWPWERNLTSLRLSLPCSEKWSQ